MYYSEILLLIPEAKLLNSDLKYSDVSTFLVRYTWTSAVIIFYNSVICSTFDFHFHTALKHNRENDEMLVYQDSKSMDFHPKYLKQWYGVPPPPTPPIK